MLTYVIYDIPVVVVLIVSISIIKQLTIWTAHLSVSFRTTWLGKKAVFRMLTIPTVCKIGICSKQLAFRKVTVLCLSISLVTFLNSNLQNLIFYIKYEGKVKNCELCYLSLAKLPVSKICSCDLSTPKYYLIFTQTLFPIVNVLEIFGLAVWL